MNVYQVTFCWECKKLVDVGSTLYLHGAANVEKANELYSKIPAQDLSDPEKRQKHLKLLWSQFCANCGGFIKDRKCGCRVGTRPQTYCNPN